jgi:ankyrin repeat protein
MAVVLQQLLEVCPYNFVDKTDCYGWSPLHILANNVDAHRIRAGMIATLCKAGAKVDTTKKRGVTPLMSAVSTGHKGAATNLLRYGADVNLETEEGTTIWDMAWHNKNMREWAEDVGVGQGAGVSGTGRHL